MNDHTSPRRAGVSIGLGAAGAAVSALAWAVLIAVTHRELGIAAIGVGVAVGYAMSLRLSSRAWLPVAGGLLSVLGCAAGAGIAAVILEARAEQVSLAYAARVVIEHPHVFRVVYASYFSPFDLFFWGLAAVTALRLIGRAPAALRQALDRARAAAAEEPGAGRFGAENPWAVGQPLSIAVNDVPAANGGAPEPAPQPAPGPTAVQEVIPAAAGTNPELPAAEPA